MRAHIVCGLLLSMPSLLTAGNDIAIVSSPAAPRVIRVSAERFAFTPGEIVVDKGTTIEFHLTSDDTDHGFKIVGTDEMRKFLLSQGAEPMLMEPAKFGAFLAAETEKWGKVVKAAGLKLE